MTTADFIAICFWPLAMGFAALLLTIRNGELFRFIGAITGATGILYFVLWFFFRQESLVAIVDQFILMGVFGAGVLWFVMFVMPAAPDFKSRLKRYGFLALGAASIFVSCTTLFRDFAIPRLVLEGRVENVRLLSNRGRERGATIAGQTVKATTPVYERLKLLPYVRVEIGRGSDYIYKIEYLAN